jgi:uncharacterized protein
MATNKELITEAFGGLAHGDGSALVGLMADDIVWTAIGTTAWSGALHGKSEVLTKLLMPLGAQLANATTVVAHRILAEGDFVVVEARGANTTRTGKDYSNTYCFVMKMADGKIKEVTEYMDTALVNASLEPPSRDPQK